MGGGVIIDGCRLEKERIGDSLKENTISNLEVNNMAVKTWKMKCSINTYLVDIHNRENGFVQEPCLTRENKRDFP